MPGFDQKVLSLYARGLTVRELQAHLEECYAVPVSADLITAVTDEVRAEVEAWQQRPLEPVDVAVAFDALRVKIRCRCGASCTRPTRSRACIARCGNRSRSAATSRTTRRRARCPILPCALR